MGGRSTEKGCCTLIHAFEQLPQIPLKILGTGPLEQELKDYVSQKGIGNIQFLGFKSGDEKWQLLRNSLCLVVPSEWYENFPVTVLEAFMAAKPVIAARMGGLPYIAEDGQCGPLFDSCKGDQLSKHIQRLSH